MKKHSITKRFVLAVTLLACASFACSVYAQGDNTQEKVSLMVSALQARDSGDLQASKAALEELVKIAPNDKGVQRMLIAVNGDIEKQAKVAAEEAAAKTAADEAAKVAAEEEAAKKAAEEAAAPAKMASEDAEKKEGEENAEPVVENVDDAMSEAVRKQNLQILAAHELIDEAYHSMDAEKWSEASELLGRAEAKLPSSEMANETRAEIKAARAAMSKELALIAISKKKTTEAKTQAADYAVNEEDAKRGEAFVAKIANAAENPYNNSIAEVDSTYVQKQKKIDELLSEGRVKYLYGDYQNALNTFREVETLDSSNLESKGYQKLIYEKLKNSNELSYAVTREAMLNEVTSAWTRPRNFKSQTISAPKDSEASPIEAKLKDIIIPEINFPDPGVPLARVIDTLSVLSREYDKKSEGEEGKRGVNMMIADVADDAKVTITLRDLSLGQVLDLVSRQTQFTYDIEKGVVVFRKGGSTTNLETKVFEINSAAITKMTGIDATASTDTSNPFGGGGSEGGGHDPSAIADGIKKFFERSGVDWAQGSNVATDGQTKLIITNTTRNLEKIQALLFRFVGEVKQVEIEAKFMEVNQGDLQELGFNYNLTKSTTDANGNITTKNIFNTSNRTLADTKQDASSSEIRISDVFKQDPMVITQYAPTIPSTINMGWLRDGLPMANAVLGVIDGYEFSMLINALDQKQGSDLLCSPKVTVHSGQEASITVSQKMRYPNEWGDVQSQVGTGSSSGGGSAGVTITPGTPRDFIEYDVGVVMRVTPTVSDDDTITLDLAPRVTEFEGFMEYGGYAVAVTMTNVVTVPSGFIQPVFSVREITTKVTVFDGATIVLGGLTREEVRRLDDSVPILGDIPLIGRLFQSKGEVSEKKNLLIFVTANTISPGGSVGRERFAPSSNYGPGTTFQNPVIVSPSGIVPRTAEISSGAEE